MIHRNRVSQENHKGKAETDQAPSAPWGPTRAARGRNLTGKLKEREGSMARVLFEQGRQGGWLEEGTFVLSLERLVGVF